MHSHLLYGLIVWRNTYSTYLSKLISLQNKALRIVTKSGWYQNVLPLYQKFNLLNLQNLHKIETAKFIHNQINQHLSPNFNNYFTLAKFSHNRQTPTTASLNLKNPLYKTKKRSNQLNIPVRKFEIPFLIILKTSHIESFWKKAKKFFRTPCVNFLVSIFSNYKVATWKMLVYYSYIIF